ncbi:MAG: VOC family protein [Candidatus Latescibacterota bacterium]|nr:VOC family protein [Candidatus Latescibacterota bacterium]
MPLGDKNAIIAGCGMHHVAVQTRDWEASLRLYRDVLGMKIVAEFGSPERQIMLLDTGDGSHVELFAPTAESPADGNESPNDPVTHFALAAADARAAAEHVRTAGYEITVEPKDVDLGSLSVTTAFFKGPCGEVVEFFQTR